VDIYGGVYFRLMFSNFNYYLLLFLSSQTALGFAGEQPNEG
jgi:hypothetical protein